MTDQQPEHSGMQFEGQSLDRSEDRLESSVDEGLVSAHELPTFAVSGHAASVLDPNAEPILEVRDLRMYFPVKSSGLIRRTIGNVQAVDGISFQVPKGGSLGLVGESGCGKSTTGRMVTRLYEPTAGSINFDGTEIAKISARRLKPLR